MMFLVILGIVFLLGYQNEAHQNESQQTEINNENQLK
jgi:hypothetical protein